MAVCAQRGLCMWYLPGTCPASLLPAASHPYGGLLGDAERRHALGRLRSYAPTRVGQRSTCGPQQREGSRRPGISVLA